MIIIIVTIVIMIITIIIIIIIIVHVRRAPIWARPTLPGKGGQCRRAL